MGASEELDVCIELEKKCSGIYRAFSRLFPEAFVFVIPMRQITK